MEGWIKLHRKTLDNPIITKDSDYLAVWIYILLNATHKEYDVIFKGKRITLQKGQLITGTISISKKLKINKDKVQRILKSFENDKQIEQQTSNRNRLISIVNWNEYQDIDKQNDKQMINKCETDDKQVITNKNVKNIKNDKNEITIISDSRVDGLEKTDDSCVDGLQEVIDFYNSNIGLVTPFILETLEDFTKEMGKDLVIYSMQISVEANKRNGRYIRAILNNWQKAGIKTLVEAKKENKTKKAKESNFKSREYSEEELTCLYANNKFEESENK